MQSLGQDSLFICCFEAVSVKQCIIGPYLSLTVFWGFFDYHETLVSVLIPSSFTDAEYPVDIKLSAYQKWYCGLWVLLSCSWYVLVLTAHWPENTHCKPEKKIIFICPWLFFLLVVRIKWNNVRGSTLYTVSYQCKMLRCVVISLIISLFRMEFPMHYYS